MLSLRLLSHSALPALLVLAGLPGAGVPVSAASGNAACQAYTTGKLVLSGPGELAMRIRCGLTSAPQVHATTPPRLHHITGNPDSVNVLVNDRSTDTYSNITQSETSLDYNGQNVVLAYNDTGQYLATGSITGYAVSSDRGTSWTDMGIIPTTGSQAGGVLGDPLIQGGPNPGEFYYAGLAVDASGLENVSATKSTDNGQTWSTAVMASVGANPNNIRDKPEMAVDTAGTSQYRGNVYVCYADITLGFIPSYTIKLSRSINGGASFQPPVTVASSGALGVVQGCALATDTQGRLYVTYWNKGLFSASMTVRRSDDAGQTWYPPRTIGSVATVGGLDGQCGSNGVPGLALNGHIRSTLALPSIAINPRNNYVFVAYPSGTHPDVIFGRSADGGQTWQTRTANQVVANDQFMPRISIDPNGTIRILYYDRREDPNNLRLNLYASQSSNGGLTFTDQKVSTSDFGVPPIGGMNFDSVVAPCYMGDYIAIQSDSTGWYQAWGDNRLDTSIYPGAPLHEDPDIRFSR